MSSASTTAINPADHLPLARSVAATVCPRSRSDFEDVCQEATIGLVQAARAFDPSRGAAFSTLAWLYVRRTALHYLKARRSRRMTTFTDLAEPGREGSSEVQVEAPSEGDVVEQDDEVARLRKALKRLHRKDAHIVRLFFGIGCVALDAARIGRIYHLPATRVRERLVKALKILKGILEAERPGTIEAC